MSDTPERKTLSVRKASGDGGEADPRRKRSGARARQVAMQDRSLAQGREPAPGAAAPARRERSAPKEWAAGPDRGSDRSRAPRAQDQSRPPNRFREQEPSRMQTPDSASGQPVAIRRRSRGPAASEIFQVFAPCPQGLEDALALELQALAYDGVQKQRAGCAFQADWTGILRANLYSRLATRILVQVAQAGVDTEDDILQLARQTPWEQWFGAEQTLRVDTSAVRSPMQSLQYCNLRAKDGICDRLREREGARPDIDTVRPDARVHLFLDARQATLYLDVSGESLFKRGWRLDKGEAPLRENLAAGLLALSGWTPDQPLLDPFCGSGTLLIEAAWIALGVPPGIWRPFSFERLRNHDARLWRDLKDDARARIAQQLEQPLLGCDLDASAIAAARSNLARAHLTPDAIRLEVADARRIAAPAPRGHIVTNPPYGERLAAGAETLWPEWAAHLKREFSGWQVNVISSDLELPARMRLKARRRHPVHNGALDCRLFAFDMVAAGYR